MVTYQGRSLMRRNGCVLGNKRHGGRRGAETRADLPWAGINVDAGLPPELGSNMEVTEISQISYCL